MQGLKPEKSTTDGHKIFKPGTLFGTNQTLIFLLNGETNYNRSRIIRANYENLLNYFMGKNTSICNVLLQ